jgi:two-component system, OmpR family, sensor histidine kinase KdpD
MAIYLRNKASPYVLSIGLVLLTTLFGIFIKGKLEPTNLVMFYLLVVVISAVEWGKGPAIVTSIISVLCFDYFLVPPYLTFTVASIHYIFTFIGLLIVGLVISTLASRMREQTIQAQQQEAQAAALYRFSDDLSNADSFNIVLQAIRKNIGQVLKSDVAIYLSVNGRLEVSSYDPDFPTLNTGQLIAAQVYKNAQKQIYSVADPKPIQISFFPLDTAQGILGVLGISFHENKGKGLAGEFIKALVNQAAMAIQRAKLGEDSRQVEIMRQTEKLQSALLHSISHDLKTPLVSIKGALTTLMGSSVDLKAIAKEELLDTAYEESERLNRLVENLLDMTKMEAGVLRITKKPCDLRDIAGASLDQLKEKIGQRSIKIDIPRDLPEITVDFSFMMKVFNNLIDNALRYSTPDSLLTIKARENQEQITIEVIDQGFGVPEADLKRIFDKFYRAEKPQQITGTGLGLSICKGIIEAHGGEIIARNNKGPGATFIIKLPRTA